MRKRKAEEKYDASDEISDKRKADIGDEISVVVHYADGTSLKIVVSRDAIVRDIKAAVEKKLGMMLIATGAVHHAS